MGTDMGHNLTRMDRHTAISESSNFPNTFFEFLHPSLVFVFIYCTDNSTSDEGYKQYSNILCTSYIEKFLTKKFQVYEITSALGLHALCSNIA
jgi:hypothetical protein